MPECYVYVFEGDGWCKVGISVDPVQRCKSVSYATGEAVTLSAAYRYPTVGAAQRAEMASQSMLAMFPQFREYFLVTPEIAHRAVGDFSGGEGSRQRFGVIASHGAGKRGYSERHGILAMRSGARAHSLDAYRANMRLKRPQ